MPVKQTGTTIVVPVCYCSVGDSAVRSFVQKRYRYTGKEKDEESGLYYYGARYYAPWTCNFLSVDPLAGKFAHQSSYCYAGCNPIVKNDPTGMAPEEKGSPGVTGVQGPAGPTGSQAGAQAPTGATGAQGVTGATGAQGVTGATGAQPPTGAASDYGPTGAVGAAGPTGPREEDPRERDSGYFKKDENNISGTIEVGFGKGVFKTSADSDGKVSAGYKEGYKASIDTKDGGIKVSIDYIGATWKDGKYQSLTLSYKDNVSVTLDSVAGLKSLKVKIPYEPTNSNLEIKASGNTFDLGLLGYSKVAQTRQTTVNFFFEQPNGQWHFHNGRLVQGNFTNLPVRYINVNESAKFIYGIERNTTYMHYEGGPVISDYGREFFNFSLPIPVAETGFTVTPTIQINFPWQPLKH